MATSGSASRTRQRKPPPGREPKGISDLQFQRCEAFYTSLSERLDVLHEEVKPKSLTLEWVTTAVDFMRSTFVDMMSLMEEDMCGPVKAADEIWIEEYMVESMKLLDVCNVLKPALSRFEHFVMCVQLVVQGMQRCSAGSKRYASDKALVAALQSCESELNQLVHPPLTMGSSLASSQPERVLRLTPKTSTDGPQRYASIAIGEKFTSPDGISRSLPYPGPSTLRDSSNRSGEASRSTVELAQVMRATREATDFVASVLIWALKRDPNSSHPASTAWQRKRDGLRGDDIRWSSSFRMLQEGLWKALSVGFRDESSATDEFAFEELKLMEECTADMRVKIEESAAREQLSEEPSMHELGNLEQKLVQLLDMIQIRLGKVSSQVDRLFDELVQARKKLLEAAMRPGKILRAQTF